MITTYPRWLKIFHPDNGGNVLWRDIGEPLETDFDEATGEYYGTGGEALEVQWKQPDGSTAAKKFYVGLDLFLDGAVNGSAITAIPQDQLLASCSMGAILAGEVHPGSYEFLSQVASDQSDKDFQTILKEVRIKSVEIVETGDPATEGNFYKVTFMRKGQSGNTKEVTADVASICKYANRANSYVLSVNNVPGAISRWGHDNGHAYIEPGDLDATLRADIVDTLKDQRFYV